MAALELLPTSPEPLAIADSRAGGCVGAGARRRPRAGGTVVCAAVLCNANGRMALALAWTVLVAVPTLLLIGAIAAALLVFGAWRLHPDRHCWKAAALAIPTLVFHAGAACCIWRVAVAELAFTGGVPAACSALCPLAASAALKISSE